MKHPLTISIKNKSYDHIPHTAVALVSAGPGVLRLPDQALAEWMGVVQKKPGQRGFSPPGAYMLPGVRGYRARANDHDNVRLR